METFDDLESWPSSQNKTNQDSTWKIVSGVLLIVSLVSTAIAAYYIGNSRTLDVVATQSTPGELSKQDTSGNLQIVASESTSSTEATESSIQYVDSIKSEGTPWVEVSMEQDRVYVSVVVQSEKEKELLEQTLTDGFDGQSLEAEIYVDGAVSAPDWMQPVKAGAKPPVAMIISDLQDRMQAGGFAISGTKGIAFGEVETMADKEAFDVTVKDCSGVIDLRNELQIV